jgi:superfamily II DNA helicase RecQ
LIGFVRQTHLQSTGIVYRHSRQRVEEVAECLNQGCPCTCLTCRHVTYHP